VFIVLAVAAGFATLRWFNTLPRRVDEQQTIVLGPTRFYLPWDQVPMIEGMDELITIDVGYDRTRLSVNDEVTVNVGVRLNREGVIKMALVDLGVPPGFTVLAEDLNRLVEQGVIAPRPRRTGGDGVSSYSYRSASIGFRREARRAG
jgi:hypothetical protein